MNKTKEMIPYLVQRAKFSNRENKIGIDSILQFDYMGSAEFEFGALPKSLGKIRKNKDAYIQFDVLLNKKPISVYCKQTQKPLIEDYLKSLSERKYHTKEFTAFDQFIKGDGYFKDKVDFWWDIEHDLMFWKKNQEFENKFKEKV